MLFFSVGPGDQVVKFFYILELIIKGKISQKKIPKHQDRIKDND